MKSPTMLVVTVVACTLCFLVPFVHGDFDSSQYPTLASEQQLMTDVFSNYQKAVLPSENVSIPVELQLSISVIDLIDLDEKTEVLEMIYWVHQSWKDVRLQWDPKDYSNLKKLTVPQDMVWRPDIQPYNNVEASFTYQDVLAIVYYTGVVFWIPVMRLRSRCQMNMNLYPMDEQICSIKFGSWAYSGQQLNFSDSLGIGLVSLVDFIPRDNWMIVSSEGHINLKRYSCCPESYPDVTVKFTFRRTSLFITRMIIIPAVFLSLIVPFQLLLPPGSKERMTLGSVLIVALLLLNLKLQDILPEHQNTSPPIHIFLMLAQLWNLLSILVSILVLNCNSRGVMFGRVPTVVKLIFLDVLRKLVCVCEQEKKESPHGIENPVAIAALAAENTSPQIRMSGDGADSSKDARTLLNIEEYLSRIVEFLNYARSTNAAKADVKNVENEWRQVALVLDRVFFIGSLVTFFLCCMALLT